MSERIKAYMHCHLCLLERPQDITPRQWARLNIGWTEEGLQVWCVRHDLNVLDIDFEGAQHPASMGREGLK